MIDFIPIKTIYLRFKTYSDRLIKTSNREKTGRSLKKMERAESVLFVGPGSFKEDVWRNRVKYILPDLFSEISKSAKISVLTGVVPAFARPGIRELEEKYSVSFFELSENDVKSHRSRWIKSGVSCALESNATVITNIFGSVQFPDFVVNIAQKTNSRSVIRIAGDEIENRISIGKYERHSKRHSDDLLLQENAFKLADEIIVMSDWERKRVRQIGVESAKIRTCYRGVNLENFNGKNNRNKALATKFLFVGRKSLEKGYDLVEEAAKRLESIYPSVQFLFAGDFEQKTIGNRQYLGFVKTEELPALYAAADVFILCSRSEGMPQALLEAMAMKKASILTKHLFYDWLQDEEIALFAEPEVEQIVAAVSKYHICPNMSVQHGENARKFAEQNFSEKHWKKVYREILLP